LLLLHWLGTAGTLRLIGLFGLSFMLVLMLTRSAARTAANVGVAAALLAVATIFPRAEEFWPRFHFINPGETGIVNEDRSGVVCFSGGPA
jgi:hypothetical protein